ncbi:ribosome silencing factor [Psychrosphaera aquimarina]|uniref:Ribosomal silencing factor RsfS n=1 Tax=Psychrosphaera aquimarina TaxID=2044854 RepID=A0ABU3R089_9GAMM|nr:ribosome silencing factor [Psychrosphaera aquimarina]MDU0112718.1 ribosome silencing factor [Psychrosphaera aquimarina]
MQNQQILEFVLDKIDDLKARDIITIDVSKTSTITDFMVICSGNSKKHVQSIADHVALEAKAVDETPLGVEGKDEGEWVLVDMGPVVLHVMQEGTRDFYQLEKLWQPSNRSSSDE